MRQSAGFAGGLLLFERIDQIHRREEAHPFAVPCDRLDTQRGGQMRLAGACAADQHDVLGALSEFGGGKDPDLPAIDLRLFEIETSQIAMDRKARRVHLVANRAQPAVDGLGLDQVLDQTFVGRQPGGRALFQPFGVTARHAVQPQRLQRGNRISHGSPPSGHGACRSAGCRLPAVPSRSSWFRRSPAAARPSVAPTR